MGMPGGILQASPKGYHGSDLQIPPGSESRAVSFAPSLGRTSWSRMEVRFGGGIVYPRGEVLVSANYVRVHSTKKIFNGNLGTLEKRYFLFLYRRGTNSLDIFLATYILRCRALAPGAQFGATFPNIK